MPLHPRFSLPLDSFHSTKSQNAYTEEMLRLAGVLLSPSRPTGVLLWNLWSNSCPSLQSAVSAMVAIQEYLGSFAKPSLPLPYDFKFPSNLKNDHNRRVFCHHRIGETPGETRRCNAVLPANSKIPREIGPYSNYPREKRLIVCTSRSFIRWKRWFPRFSRMLIPAGK